MALVAQEEREPISKRTKEALAVANAHGLRLGKALHLAKVTAATLVIAKLDRLSRNAAFLLTLRV